MRTWVERTSFVIHFKMKETNNLMNNFTLVKGFDGNHIKSFYKTKEN